MTKSATTLEWVVIQLSMSIMFQSQTHHVQEKLSQNLEQFL